jgi:intracellular septation protein A
MSDPQRAPESQDLKLNFRKRFGGLLPPIIISAVFPVLIYLLASPHMSTLPALALTAVPPMLYSVYGWVRTHSIDPISIIALFMVVISMLITLLVHDPHLFLIRDSYLIAAFGLLCLISLLFPRPVAFYLYRWAFVRTPEQLASLNAGWQVPYVRFVHRLVTVVWGLAFLGEALTDTYLAYHLPIASFLVIHPFLFNGTILVAFGWATLYSMHVQKRRRAIEAHMRQTEQERATSPGKDRVTV